MRQITLSNGAAKSPTHYYNYRHYTPLDGRWTGRDLNGIFDGLNDFLFILNIPMAKRDSLGLASKRTCGKCGKGNLGKDYLCENDKPVRRKEEIITIYFGHCNGPLQDMARKDSKSRFVGAVTCFADSTLDENISPDRQVPNTRDRGEDILPKKESIEALRKEIRAAEKQASGICKDRKYKSVKIKIRATDMDGMKYLRKAYPGVGSEKTITKQCPSLSCAERGGVEK